MTGDESSPAGHADWRLGRASPRPRSPAPGRPLAAGGV